jgi:hypothetical protein
MPRKFTLQTEFTFTLPRGLVDSRDHLHRQGLMRLATALDEISVENDRRVRNNQAYRPLVMFSRVITRLGSLTAVAPEQLEGLFSRDLAYLREFYNRINQQGDAHIPTQCPECNAQFAVELALSGES